MYRDRANLCILQVVKVISNFPVSIVTHGCALNITLTSYIDRLDFGLVACKIAVPDVQDIADDILKEFKLLKKAVAANTAAPAKKTVPKPKKKSTKVAAKT